MMICSDYQKKLLFKDLQATIYIYILYRSSRIQPWAVLTKVSTAWVHSFGIALLCALQHYSVQKHVTYTLMQKLFFQNNVDTA